MGYTRRKIRGINFSFLMASFVFACGATYCAWYGWPRGFRGGSAAGFGLFALGALLFMTFPTVWMFFPQTHPVRRELSHYGDFEQISERLDIEMAEQVEVVGPFRFTATTLVYDIFHEFQMVPYDQIVDAKLEWSPGVDGPDTPTIAVYTCDGRRYQWYRTWMQGIFNPETTLEKIRAAAHLDDKSSSASPVSSGVDSPSTAHPSPASQAPSTTD
jgi:hypothetical protein